MGGGDMARICTKCEVEKELDVDHIWPLKGENSCGLNVPWNLWVLTKDANVRKGRADPDLPSYTRSM